MANECSQLHNPTRWACLTWTQPWPPPLISSSSSTPHHRACVGPLLVWPGHSPQYLTTPHILSPVTVSSWTMLPRATLLREKYRAIDQTFSDLPHLWIRLEWVGRCHKLRGRSGRARRPEVKYLDWMQINVRKNYDSDSLELQFYFVQKIEVPKRLKLKHLVRTEIFFLSKVKF